jgi:hypothetical protein
MQIVILLMIELSFANVEMRKYISGEVELKEALKMLFAYKDPSKIKILQVIFLFDCEKY